MFLSEKSSNRLGEYIDVEKLVSIWQIFILNSSVEIT